MLMALASLAAGLDPADRAFSAADLGLRPSVTTAGQPPPPLRTRRYAPDAPPALQRANLPQPTRNGGPQEALLELWVNGRRTDVVARTRSSEGMMLVDRSALAAAGFAVGAAAAQDEFVPLSSVGVVAAEMSAGAQQLMIATPATAAPVQVLDAGAVRVWASGRSGTGFMARYDVAGFTGLSGTARSDWSMGAALAAAVFTPRGTATSTGLLRVSDADSALVRLDSAVAIEDARTLQRWTLGDTLSSNLRWSRSVRFAGLQFVRDFSLRPEMVTLPSRDIRGEAAAPSTVDVFVNAARVYSAEVAPGPFLVRNIPMVTGRGEAVVVVRDTLGREVATVLPLFVGPDLLAKGLSSYALEIGLRRRFYGIESFDYGSWMAAGTMRQGVSDWLTLESHAEATRKVQVAGAGGSFSFGRFGVGSVDLATSRSGQGSGWLYGLSGQTQAGPVGFFGAYTAVSGSFVDIAGDDGFPLPRSRLQLGASAGGRGFGSLAASWISETRSGQDLQFATLSYSRALPMGAQFGASAFRSLPGSHWSGHVFLRAPLGARTAVTAWSDARRGGADTGLALMRAADPDGGIGYNLAASAGPVDRARADATWIGPKLRADAALTLDGSAFQGQAALSGDIVGIDGSVFLAPASDGPFALVKTGQPGVRVSRENREIAVTDARGRAIIANLNPNAVNRISVDPTDFPLAAELGPEVQEVAPRRRSGVMLDFTPRPAQAALAVLRRSGGGFPPPGSQVELAGGEKTVIGRNGELFLKDFAGPTQGLVRFEGGACRFSLGALPAPTDGIPRLEPAVCTEAPVLGD